MKVQPVVVGRYFVVLGFYKVRSRVLHALGIRQCDLLRRGHKVPPCFASFSTPSEACLYGK